MVTAHRRQSPNREQTERMLKLVDGAAGAEALPALVRLFDASRCSPASQHASTQKSSRRSRSVPHPERSDELVVLVVVVVVLVVFNSLSSKSGHLRPSFDV